MKKDRDHAVFFEPQDCDDCDSTIYMSEYSDDNIDWETDTPMTRKIDNDDRKSVDNDDESDFRITDIDIREREDKHKWDVDPYSYKIIAKYLGDTKDRVNLSRVSTRSKDIFGTFMNMGINITDPEYWEKLNTHVIYTDLERGISDFLPVEQKRLYGNYMSFKDFFDVRVVLYISKEEGIYKIIAVKGEIPSDIIDFVNKYLEYKQGNTMGIVDKDTGESHPDHSLLNVIVRDTKLYITQDELSEYLYDSKSVFDTNLYTLLQYIFADDEFMEQYTTQHTLLISGRQEQYLNIQGVDVPMLHYDDYKDNSVMKMILNCCNPTFSVKARTKMEDINIYRFAPSDYEPGKTKEHFDMEVDRFETIIAVQIETITVDFEEYDVKAADIQKKEGTYTVVYLPVRLYNYLVPQLEGKVDPITDYACYIKGTTTFITTYQLFVRYMSELLYEAKTIDGDYPMYKRFIKLVDAYHLGDYSSLINVDFPEEYVRLTEGQLSLNYLLAKYGYVCRPINQYMLPNKAHVAICKHEDIFQYVVEKQIQDVIVPFCTSTVINSVGYNNYYEIPEDNYLVYYNDQFITLRQYATIVKNQNIPYGDPLFQMVTRGLYEFENMYDWMTNPTGANVIDPRYYKGFGERRNKPKQTVWNTKAQPIKPDREPEERSGIFIFGRELGSEFRTNNGFGNINNNNVGFGNNRVGFGNINNTGFGNVSFGSSMPFGSSQNTMSRPQNNYGYGNTAYFGGGAPKINKEQNNTTLNIPSDTQPLRSFRNYESNFVKKKSNNPFTPHN